MKRIISMLIMAVMMTAFSSTTYAQDTNDRQQKREKLAETQARHIARQLAFDDATTAKFIDTYCQCQKEIWALGPRAKRQRGTAKTDAETEKAIEERFERSQKLLDIREKYYKEYSKFLTSKQIQRVYAIEKRMMGRLGKNAGKRHPRPRR